MLSSYSLQVVGIINSLHLLLMQLKFATSALDIKTLFVDHPCGLPNGARAPSPVRNPLLGRLPKVGGYPSLAVHGVLTKKKAYTEQAKSLFF